MINTKLRADRRPTNCAAEENLPKAKRRGATAASLGHYGMSNPWPEARVATKQKISSEDIRVLKKKDGQDSFLLVATGCLAGVER